MRYALISDIHSNREALDATFKEIDALGVDSIICLGDIVGYGPDPNYCVELVRQRADIAIIGNHDEAAINPAAAYNFNHYARKAAIWTNEILTPENRDFLISLGYSIVEDNMFLVHSSPYNPEEWNYIFNFVEAKWQFKYFKQRICFIGHTHYPVQFNDEETGRKMVNIGSVGQPRDNDPRACFYIYDSDSCEGDWVRVEYPLNITARKIRDAGLPSFLAERLLWGR